MTLHIIQCAVSLILGGAGGYMFNSVLGKMRGVKDKQKIRELARELEQLQLVVTGVQGMIDRWEGLSLSKPRIDRPGSQRE